MYYLTCDDCGERFDTLEDAYEHTHDAMIQARFYVDSEDE